MKMAKGLLWGLFLSLIITHFFLLDHSRQIIGDGGDNYEYFAFQNLVKENLENKKYPLAWTNTLRYPVGFNLGVGYDGALAVFSGAFLGNFLSSGLAYNLSVVLILVFNFFSAYWLASKISGSTGVGLLAGLAYGFSPYVLARINAHLNLALVSGFPFLAYSLINLCQKANLKIAPKIKDSALFFLSLLLIAFGSLQYLIFTVYLSLIGLIFGLIFFKEKTRYLILSLFNCFKKNKLLWLISFSIFVVLFLLFYYQYILAIISQNLVWIDKTKIYSAFGRPRFLDLLLPNQYLGGFWKNLNPSPASIEKVATPGIAAWLLFFFLFFKEKKGLWKLSLLITVFLFSLLILGVWRLPLLVEGSRWVVFLNLGLLLLIIRNHKYLSKILLILFCFLLFLEKLSFPPQTSFLFPETIANIIRRSPGEAVLNIPLSKYSAYYSTLPFSWEKKIVDGYFHFTADNKSANQFLNNHLLHPFICQEEKEQLDNSIFQEKMFKETLELLKENKIKTIVVHKDPNYSKFLHSDCQNVHSWWSKLNPETIKIQEKTLNIQAKTVELTNYQNLKTKLYFPSGGEFGLIGLSVFPLFLNDIQIALPKNQIIFPSWELKGESLATINEPLVSLSVRPGDEIIFSSQKEVVEPIYFTIFYLFEPAGKEKNEPPLEKILENEFFEIFVIN